MSMSDPLGDMLTRIRNGQHAKKPVVMCPASRQKARVLDVLAREGFIRGYKEVTNDAGHADLQIELKYDETTPVIRELHRVSKPGRRVYFGVNELPRFYNGLGVTVVSTPKGVMADHEARTAHVGGEILCQVF
jgi:small subunit ribosomal protein S8